MDRAAANTATTLVSLGVAMRGSSATLAYAPDSGWSRKTVALFDAGSIKFEVPKMSVH